ncbi:MAG: KamA family radical SAM protein [Desulfatibacillaceae bacterium]
MANEVSLEQLDQPTGKLIEELSGQGSRPAYSHSTHDHVRQLAYGAYLKADQKGTGKPDEPGQAENIVRFFTTLRGIRRKQGFFSDQLGFPQKDLVRLALLHRRLDEHGVTVGGRVYSAIEHVEQVSRRRADYMENRPRTAPSGLDLWPRIQENKKRIQAKMRMSDQDWNSYSGQMTNAVDSLITLSQIVDLPEKALIDLMRATKTFRMRITPYFASLIMADTPNDPVMLQCVPTGEMLDAPGKSKPPICRAHSPARLVDQIYPSTVAIKCTNTCPVYCTHCVRREFIGDRDVTYPVQAYSDAIEYVRGNKQITDVLLTGGDPLMLPDKLIAWLLTQLDRIPHVRTKRIGTRVPVALPHRVSQQLLDILGKSNDAKPVRIFTHINSAREITPLSRQVLKKLSTNVAGVLNQAVLLRGVNDSRDRMWSLCEHLLGAYVKPHYLMQCSERHPQFAHLRVPVSVGRGLVESMYGNLPGDAIPRYVALSTGKVPLASSHVIQSGGNKVVLCRPWDGQEVVYQDADTGAYKDPKFGFARYEE